MIHLNRWRTFLQLEHVCKSGIFWFIFLLKLINFIADLSCRLSISLKDSPFVLVLHASVSSSDNKC